MPYGTGHDNGAGQAMIPAHAVVARTLPELVMLQTSYYIGFSHATHQILAHSSTNPSGMRLLGCVALLSKAVGDTLAVVDQTQRSIILSRRRLLSLHSSLHASIQNQF